MAANRIRRPLILLSLPVILEVRASVQFKELFIHSECPNCFACLVDVIVVCYVICHPG